jgi:hypothetical protein
MQDRFMREICTHQSLAAKTMSAFCARSNPSRSSISVRRASAGETSRVPRGVRLSPCYDGEVKISREPENRRTVREVAESQDEGKDLRKLQLKLMAVQASDRRRGQLQDASGASFGEWFVRC